MTNEGRELESEFVRAAPVQTRKTLRALLGQPRLPAEALAKQVRDHTAQYLEAARGKDLDADLARAIEARLLRQLAALDPRAPATQRRLVQAACEYYVFAHDADEDFASLTGLDDDAEVVNALLFVLGDEDSILIG